MYKTFVALGLLFATTLVWAGIGIVWLARLHISVNTAILVTVVMWFVTSGTLIAGTLEEAGRCFAEFFNLPAVGKYFFFASYNLLRFPAFRGDSQKAECATELARLFVMQGQLSEARRWSVIAAKHIYEETKDRFRTLSRQGWVYFRLGEFDKSERCLTRALSKFSNPKNLKLDPFSNDDLCWLAIDYDLLAKIELRNNKVADAEKFFRKSAQMRGETKDLVESAMSYAENFEGTLLLDNLADKTAAEIRVLEAARLLPEDLKSEHAKDVAFDVIQNLERLESPEAKTALKFLSSRCNKKAPAEAGAL